MLIFHFYFKLEWRLEIAVKVFCHFNCKQNWVKGKIGWWETLFKLLLNYWGRECMKTAIDYEFPCKCQSLKVWQQYPECNRYFMEHVNENMGNKVIHLCPQAWTCKLYTLYLEIFLFHRNIYKFCLSSELKKQRKSAGRKRGSRYTI